METVYENSPPQPATLDHEYGDNIHIVADAFSLSMLAKLCSAEVVQPRFNQFVRRLYAHLMVQLVNTRFPTRCVQQDTRMKDLHPGGVYRGQVVDPATQLVVVDVARAGILPSQVCFDIGNDLLDPAGVRQDHIVMERTTDETGAVNGVQMSGAKIGGPIDGRHVIFPDPMGATGTSLSRAIGHYKKHVGSAPASISTLNLMVTPEYLRTMTQDHPEVHVFALRVDRGASTASILGTPLGAKWSEETGLTDTDYIVPGGGGFGELMNNSYC